MKKNLNEKNFLIILIIFNLFIRLYRINSPPFAYLNEKYFILPAARSILAGLGDSLPITPPSPLGKILFAFSLKIFGDNPFGWRILPAVFTTISVVLTYYLAKIIFKSRLIAALASTLFTFETATFVHSRSADPEALVVTFILAALIFSWKTLINPRPLFYFASGTFFGLATIVKPQAFLILFASIFTILLFSSFNLKQKFTACAVIFLITIATYTTGFMSILKINSLSGFIQLQKEMKRYHTEYWPQNYYRAFEESEYAKRLPALNKYIRYPISWLGNPKIPYVEKDADNKKEVVLFTFNPLTFFPIIFTFLWGLIVAFKNKDKRLYFLLATGSAAYIPYLLSSFYKPLTYPPYYLLFGLPSLIILLGYFLNILWMKSKLVVVVYLLLVTAAFALYYPLLTAMPVSNYFFTILTGLNP